MFYIGTAGYSYRDWIGPFYPPGTASEEMLKIYAKEFHFVEVNSTYYRLPHWKMIKNMEEKTPPDFQFVVKAHQSITHHPTKDFKINCNKIKEALQPLLENGKMGGILAQFPYSFQNNEENRKYILDCRESLFPLPLIVEFRRAEWQQEPLFNFLRKNNIAYACVDEPPLKGLMDPLALRTVPLFYLRFHGRNAAKWWNHQNAYERYDYLYTQEELEEWIPKILNIARDTEKLFIAFNNHFQGKAVSNSRMMKTLLSKEYT